MSEDLRALVFQSLTAADWPPPPPPRRPEVKSLIDLAQFDDEDEIEAAIMEWFEVSTANASVWLDLPGESESELQWPAEEGLCAVLAMGDTAISFPIAHHLRGLPSFYGLYGKVLEQDKEAIIEPCLKLIEAEIAHIRSCYETAGATVE